MTQSKNAARNTKAQAPTAPRKARPVFAAVSWWDDDLTVLENNDLTSLIKDLCEHLQAGREDYSWGATLPGWSKQLCLTMGRVHKGTLTPGEGFECLERFIVATNYPYVDSAAHYSSDWSEQGQAK